MTQEEKQLLLRDISARIPYRLKFFVDNTIPPLPSSEDYKRGEVFSVLTATGLDIWEDCIFTEETGMDCVLFSKRPDGEEIQELKPFLRPMSSMTEKENEEYNGLLFGVCDFTQDTSSLTPVIELTTFFYSHHIDCCGLIEKGLALEAPKDMYRYEND